MARKRILGKEQVDIWVATENLAVALKLLCRNDEAITWIETCFKVRKQSLCSKYPDEDLLLDISTEWHIKIKPYDSVYSVVAEH
jgi:hypothetical protein